MRHDRPRNAVSRIIAGAILLICAACSGEPADATASQADAESAVAAPLKDLSQGTSERAVVVPRDTETLDPSSLQGEPYDQARASIIGQGWMPRDGDCVGGGTIPAICSQYPEIETCSGTGQGLCSLKFEKPGRCLAVVTIGGPPGPNGSGDTRIDGASVIEGSCDFDAPVSGGVAG